MKKIYPVIFTLLNDEKETVLIEVPDWDILTEGYGIANAFDMTRDAIGLKAIYFEDEKRDIPEPSEIQDMNVQNGVFAGDGCTYIFPVDIDFSEYRAKIDNDMETNSGMLRENMPDKSFLVFDTPANCTECPLSLDVEDTHGHAYMGNICRKEGKTNPDSTKKPVWCPLKSGLIYKNQNEYNNSFESGFAAGYNACIDEILKERG